MHPAEIDYLWAVISGFFTSKKTTTLNPTLYTIDWVLYYPVYDFYKVILSFNVRVNRVQQ